MKILSIGNFGTSWDSSVCDETHIADALESLGHEVVRMQRESTQGDYDYPQVDLTLISQWANYPAEIVTTCKGVTKGPVIYWAFDYQWDAHENWHFELARQADIFLSKEMAHREHYKSLGANFHWLPQDFAPAFLDRAWDKEVTQDIEVLFTGTYLSQCPYRTEVLQAVDKAFNLQVYSVTADAWRTVGLKHVHEAKVDQGLMELVPRARINLSVDLYQSEGYWSDRNAQVMACGGLVLFNYVPLSEVVFRDAVQYFYSPEDCVAKIRDLLTQDLLPLETYGWLYARQNLMVLNRVQDMLTIAGKYL